jgi:hypothetical protein
MSSSACRGPDRPCRKATAPAIARAAKNRLMYRHQRQDRYEVSAPPSSSPTAPPPAATEP